MNTTFVRRNGKIVNKNRAGPRHSSNSATNVITDEMDATRHMATGEMVTSKAKFREMTRASGCTEVGNETKYMTAPRKPIRMDSATRREHIKQAIYQLRNGRS